MTEQTRMMIATAVRCDGTITKDERKAIESLLEGRGAATEPERLYKVAEVARLLGRTPKCIREWCKAGHLKRVQLPGHTNTSGIPASSVEALLKGGAA